MSAQFTCTSLFILNEVYVANIPAILFVPMAVVNFVSVRSIGFNRVVKYSPLFKSKRVLMVLMICLNIAKIVTSLVTRDAHIVQDCPKLEYVYITMKVIQIISWVAGYFLLVYQYRKGLSEKWYSHTMYWYLNFAVYIYIGIYALCEGFYNHHQIVIWALYISLSGALVFSLMKTTRRSEHLPR